MFQAAHCNYAASINAGLFFGGGHRASTAIRGTFVCPIRDLPETVRTSQQYYTEEFEEDPQLSLPLCRGKVWASRTAAVNVSSLDLGIEKCGMTAPREVECRFLPKLWDMIAMQAQRAILVFIYIICLMFYRNKKYLIPFQIHWIVIHKMHRLKKDDVWKLFNTSHLNNQNIINYYNLEISIEINE